MSGGRKDSGSVSAHDSVRRENADGIPNFSCVLGLSDYRILWWKLSLPLLCAHSSLSLGQRWQ